MLDFAAGNLPHHVGREPCRARRAEGIDGVLGDERQRLSGVFIEDGADLPSANQAIDKSVGVMSEGFAAAEGQLVNSIHFEYVGAIETQPPLVETFIAEGTIGGLFRTAVALVLAQGLAEDVTALKCQALRKALVVHSLKGIIS